MKVVESLVQVTVVTGPPVEIQAKVNGGLAQLRSESTVTVIVPTISISPKKRHDVLLLLTSALKVRVQQKYICSTCALLVITHQIISS